MSDIEDAFRRIGDAVKVGCEAMIVGTGHDAPSDQVYVGSAMLAGGTFVFHVFDGGDA